ncbi:hypothetical protein A2U01_0091947, partial [Trifolium medium]|nr:hypothetical protein [Trifolium medium]
METSTRNIVGGNPRISP